MSRKVLIAVLLCTVLCAVLLSACGKQIDEPLWIQPTEDNTTQTQPVTTEAAEEPTEPVDVPETIQPSTPVETVPADSSESSELDENELPPVPLF